MLEEKSSKSTNMLFLFSCCTTTQNVKNEVILKMFQFKDLHSVKIKLVTAATGRQGQPQDGKLLISTTVPLGVVFFLSCIATSVKLLEGGSGTILQLPFVEDGGHEN